MSLSCIHIKKSQPQLLSKSFILESLEYVLKTTECIQKILWWAPAAPALADEDKEGTRPFLQPAQVMYFVLLAVHTG